MEPTQLEQTITSVERMQNFDPQTLERRTELGSMNFVDAVAPARTLVSLYQRLSISVLPDFPNDILAALKNQADADFNRFSQILEFKLEQSDPANVRTNLISQIKGAYDVTFRSIWQYIAYGVSKITDTQRLESEARGVLQSIRDEAGRTADQIKGNADQAQAALEEIRRVATEQGVSQQAIYFKSEAESHSGEAEKWYGKTVKAAQYLGGFALLSIGAAYIPSLQPDTNIQAVQIVSSKLLVFGVLAYWLGLCAKNYLSHKHNQVINRHRENALKTFQALAEGAGNPDNKDIVLTHASQCIFSAQETGYIKQGSGGEAGSSIRSVIEVLPKALAKESHA